MLFRISKIQFFESNSQRQFLILSFSLRCSEYQRYNFLKAIHNGGTAPTFSAAVVQNIKDTIFWKQFTTSFLLYYGFDKLFRISKIQFFESNSQPLSVLCTSCVGCSEYQRYNFLKAIHNCGILANEHKYVVQNIKDTIFWKQFTTM